MSHLRNQSFEKATIDKDQLQRMIDSVQASSTKDVASLAVNSNMPALLYFILSSNESKYIGAMVIDRNLKKYAILDTKIAHEGFNKVKIFNNCTADRKIRLIEQCNASAISSTKLHKRNLAITNDRANLNVGLFKNQISEKIKDDTYWFSNLMSDAFINKDLFNKKRDIECNTNDQYTRYTNEHNPIKSSIDLDTIEKSIKAYNEEKDQIIDSLAKIKYGTFEEELNNSILPFVIFEIIAKSSNGDVLTNARLLDIQNAKTKENLKKIGSILSFIGSNFKITEKVLAFIPLAPFHSIITSMNQGTDWVKENLIPKMDVKAETEASEELQTLKNKIKTIFLMNDAESGMKNKSSNDPLSSSSVIKHISNLCSDLGNYIKTSSEKITLNEDLEKDLENQLSEVFKISLLLKEFLTLIDNGESQDNTLTNKIAQLEKVVQERIGKYDSLDENELNDLLVQAVKKAFELKSRIKYKLFHCAWSSPEEREILIEDYKQARTLVIILIDKGAKIDKIKPQIDEYKKSKKDDAQEIQKFYERFRILPREVIVFEFMHNIKMFKDRCIFTNTLFYKNYIETSELDCIEQNFFPLLAKEEEILKKIENKILQSQTWSQGSQQKHRAASDLTNFFRLIFCGRIDFAKYNNKLKQYERLQNDAKLNHNLESFFVLADELEEISKDGIWSREHEWFFAHFFEKDKDSIYCKSIATFVSEELNEIYKIRKELEGLEGLDRTRKIKEIGGYVRDSNYSQNEDNEAEEQKIVGKNEVRSANKRTEEALAEKKQALAEKKQAQAGMEQAQAGMEQAQAKIDRKKNRTKKGKELISLGKIQEGIYELSYETDSDEENKKHTKFVKNNYSFAGLEQIFSNAQSL